MKTIATLFKEWAEARIAENKARTAYEAEEAVVKAKQHKTLRLYKNARKKWLAAIEATKSANFEFQREFYLLDAEENTLNWKMVEVDE